MTDKFPSEWQVMRIGDLFEAKAGGDHDPSSSSDVRDNRYPYPIYANSLTQQGLYGFCSYAEEPAGSITVTGRGTLGKAFYRDTSFVAIGRLIVLRPKSSIDARFFCEYINFGIEFAVESTGVPQLTAPQISNYLLPVPSESEQRAIAEALSDVDGLLNALGALIAKKCAIKQATMQQLLTSKTRLPGFSGAWEAKRLGEITNIQKGSLITEKSVIPGPIPVIAGGQQPAYYHNVANRTGKTITVSGSRGLMQDLFALYNQTNFLRQIVRLLAKVPVFQLILFIIIWYTIKIRFIRHKPEGAQPHVHPVDLMPLEVNLPELSEQKAIASVLSDMDAEITALEQRRDKTIAIKQGMMQQLLTGRVRLVKSNVNSKVES